LFLTADETGAVHLSCPTQEYGRHLKPSDIVVIRGGYSAIAKNCLQLNAGRTGSIRRIGEYYMTFSDGNNISKIDLNKITAPSS
jgi:hypothetical protein